MATRFRRILFITAGVILAPVVIAALYVSFLALRPEPALPKSRLLPPPDHLTATAGRGQITIQWNDAPGAVSYRIYRSQSADKGFKLVNVAHRAMPAVMRLILGSSLPLPHHSRSPFVDTAVENRTYYYRVRAFDGSGWSELSLPASAIPEGAPGRVRIQADAARETGPLARPWEIAIGSEHPGYYLKEDAGRGLKSAGLGLRRANKRMRTAFDIRCVRAHGILSDVLGSYRETPDGKPVYDWSRIDLVYDMLRADGLKPIVELSFMPAALAADPGKTIFDYHAVTSPPKDYRKWGDLVGALAAHLMERYGREEVITWPFEVWNEPDFSMPFLGTFWQGTMEDYYRLYDYSAQALKNADARIQVGGPAAARVESIEPFLRHVATANLATGGNRAPLDFLSLHLYSGFPLDLRSLCERHGFKDLPVYYTEWGVSDRLGAVENDLAYGAAWMVRGLMETGGRAAMVVYWTSSDYFEEQGDPTKLFHGGYGLLGIDGLRKPRYWAYYMLRQLEGPQVALEGSGDGFGGLVHGWATRAGDGSLKVLLANATQELSQAGGVSLLDREVTLELAGLAPGARYRLRHYRVDNTHSNVHTAWLEMKKPDWPTAVQLMVLHQRDQVDFFEPDREVTAGGDGTVKLQFVLPMPALSLVICTPVPPPDFPAEFKILR